MGGGNERALNSRIVCKTGDPPETRYGEWGRERELFSKKRAKIVDVSGKDRAARPLANKCHVRVRKLSGLAELTAEHSQRLRHGQPRNYALP